MPRDLPDVPLRAPGSTCGGPAPGASSSSRPTARPRAGRRTSPTASSGRWPWPRRRSSACSARLLERHNGDRVLIFTHDNATVYTIARQFLVPVITHQTKTKERRDVLLRFNSGEYPIVATSRVLNEGVNVPEANVAVILSGSGSVREHVQRLGPDPPEVGRQGGDPLRGRHPRDRRGVHLQPPPPAQRLRRRLSRDRPDARPMSTKLAFLTCLASTLFMTGVIWFVHVVHYPLFDRVDAEAFRRYHAEHTRTTTYVVVLPMVVELLTSVCLVASRPEGSSRGWPGSGWPLPWSRGASTFFLSVPAHDRLAGGFDAEAHRIAGPDQRDPGRELDRALAGPARHDRPVDPLIDPDSPTRASSMLTGNLVRVRFSKQRVIPLYLNRDDPQWLEVAESLLLIFREGVGRTRGEIEAEIDELVGEGLATLAHRGLAKVLEDRAEFEVVADVPPESLREKVFTAAAEHRKALRAAGQARAAVPPRRGARRRSPRELDLAPEQVAAALFADLRDENRLLSFDRPRRPAAGRPLQRGPGAGGPAPLGPGRGRGPQREARPLPPALPPAQVPPAPLPGRGGDGATATSSTSTAP